MVNVNINVDINNVKIQEIPQLETGELNVTNLVFSFSNEYNSLVKYCIFSKDETKYRLTINNDTCKIPKDLFNDVGELTIGVYAENENNTLRYSPVPTKLKIVKGSYNGTEEPEKPSNIAVIPENTHPFFGEIVLYDYGPAHYAFNVAENPGSSYWQFIHLNDEEINDFIKGIDFSNVSDFRYMFTSSNIENVPDINTGNATDMSYMFQSCTKLKEAPNMDTSKVENMEGLFEDCGLITNIPQYDTSNVTNMAQMFAGCTSLEKFPQIDISKVTDMSFMFSDCISLVEVQDIDTSKVESVHHMFMNCSSLKEIPLFDLSSVVEMASMFENVPFLSDESINNILGMCVTATNVDTHGFDKSLEFLGLDTEKDYSVYSNYDAFIEAGWKVKDDSE